MSIVSLSKAQETLSDLVSAAARGEEVIIERDGVPAARLVAVSERSEEETPGQRLARGIGAWKGKFEPPTWEEWKAMDAEIEKDFQDAIDKPFPQS